MKINIDYNHKVILQLNVYHHMFWTDVCYSRRGQTDRRSVNCSQKVYSMIAYQEITDKVIDTCNDANCLIGI